MDLVSSMVRVSKYISLSYFIRGSNPISGYITIQQQQQQQILNAMEFDTITFLWVSLMIVLGHLLVEELQVGEFGDIMLL